MEDIALLLAPLVIGVRQEAEATRAGAKGADVHVHEHEQTAMPVA
jgi:hypothetical protein